MKKNHICDLLNTICQYNNVRITQTFTLDKQDLITARCVPNTITLELSFIETGAIEHYNSIDEAAAVIDMHLSRNHVF